MDKLLTAKDVMAILNIKPSTFYSYLKTKRLPQPINILDSAKGKRWTQTQIKTYIEKQREFYQLRIK